MLGGILVKLAFLACLLSVGSYYAAHRRGDERFVTLARISYILTFLFVLGIAGFFLSLILTHQFQYTYVWSYSSRSLSLPLLISTFYAGQEGSFMLWTLFTSVIGVVLMRYTARKDYEAAVMTVYGLVNAVLLLMLVVKDPFMYVWESWPGQVAAGFVPADGRGLNPLLQNYWMVIHPQVLFSGFSAMAVPYAYAMAALMKRDYRHWIRPATPWLVFAALVLGTGIIMGGFWAYETLGWGGYWGWDPVENSSLVPWLFSLAAIHTMLAQRRSGGYIKTNLVLGTLCFLAVLYSTFLTRSGVLGDTSVHSFVDPGMAVYWLLVGTIALFAGIAAFMLIRRWREIPKPLEANGFYSREFALSLGTAALVSAALLITAGTSSPLITDLTSGTKSAVDSSYYAKTMLPLGVMIGVLSGLGQLLWWNRTRKHDFLRSLRIPLVLAAATALVLSIIGDAGLGIGLFLFGAAFALYANLQVGRRLMQGNPRYAGGAVAHVGMAIMFFGFVASSEYNQQQTISLAEGQPVETLGYTLTYAGYHPIDKEKYAFLVDVEREGKKFRVSPVMYYSNYNEGVMRNPDILNLITKDFYLAPLSLEKTNSGAHAGEGVTLRRGESRTVGEVQIQFVDFVVPDVGAMMEGKEMKIGAILNIQAGKTVSATITPTRIIRGSTAEDIPVKVGDRYEVVIRGVHPDAADRNASTVELGVRDVTAGPPAQERDILVAEASVKPFINLVWSGVIVLLVGFGITIVRRAREASERRLPRTVKSHRTPVPNV